jgi:hypothetical protein
MSLPPDRTPPDGYVRSLNAFAGGLIDEFAVVSRNICRTTCTPITIKLRMDTFVGYQTNIDKIFISAL